MSLQLATCNYLGLSVLGEQVASVGLQFGVDQSEGALSHYLLASVHLGSKYAPKQKTI